MVSIQAITVLLVLNIDLGTAINCKSGSCRNYKEVDGCTTHFKDINCKSDYVCYNEIHNTYNFEQEKFISSGCISTKDGNRLKHFYSDWQLDETLNQTLTVDEINYFNKRNFNKACKEKEIKGEKVSKNNGSMDEDVFSKKIVEACLCNTDFCNTVSSSGKIGMNLVLIGLISILL